MLYTSNMKDRAKASATVTRKLSHMSTATNGSRINFTKNVEITIRDFMGSS